MARPTNLFFLSTLMLFVSVNFAAQPENLVKASLMSDVATFKPGETFTVGIQLKIVPKWHIYWLNPGDSGTPTTIKFKLPAGFTAGEIQLPTPITFTQPGDIVGYGYKDEVMFLAKITAPSEWKSGNAATITARAEWLVCDDVCIPGDAEVSITIPCAETTPSAQAPMIRRTEQLIPLPADAATSIKSRVTDGVVTVEIVQPWHFPPGQVEFFPGVATGLTLSDIKVHPTIENQQDHQTKISFRASPLTGQRLPEVLKNCVIGYRVDSKESPRGIMIDIPLTEAPLSGNKTDKSPSK